MTPTTPDAPRTEAPDLRADEAIEDLHRYFHEVAMGGKLVHGSEGEANLLREVARIVRSLSSATPAPERPCPWCGHPPVCHKGPEGECPS